MKKSLIVAATFAAISLGAANVASAGVAGTSLAGISAHADTQITDKVRYRHWASASPQALGLHVASSPQALLVALTSRPGYDGGSAAALPSSDTFGCIAPHIGLDDNEVESCRNSI